MPTSKTIYEAFDGKEFTDEKTAKEYEEWVIEKGRSLRKEFFIEHPMDYLVHIDPKLLDFIKSYSDDDAWKLMKSLYCAGKQIDNRLSIIENNDWLDPYK